MRGLNEPPKVKGVKCFLTNHNVHVCGLFKTRVEENNQISKCVDFGSNWSWVANNSFNRKGRIQVGWHNAFVELHIIFSNSQIIHCRITGKAALHDIVITFAYGFVTIGDGKSLWAGLYDIVVSVLGPWCLVGDFNAIFSLEHRQGGNTPSSYEMKDLCYRHNELQVYPIKSVGGFTWNNRDGIKSKIDHIFGNVGWQD